MTTVNDPSYHPLLKVLNIRRAIKTTSSSVYPVTIWWRKTPHRDIIWLLGDREEQGDSLDISWVLTITLSLVVSTQVIFFTMIPSCLKLVIASLFMLRVYSYSLPEMKYLTMVC